MVIQIAYKEAQVVLIEETKKDLREKGLEGASRMVLKDHGEMGKIQIS